MRKNVVRVSTRYAPSPTGRLHIGGARTALFNYLFAKKHDGKFILRIEDTDIERNIENGHVVVENDLKSIHLFPDESFSIPGSGGPYLQSQKLDRYSALCEQLLQEGKAYRCFCTSRELDQYRKLALENNSAPMYSKKCRHLSQKDIDTKLAKNVPYTVRLKMDLLEKYEWEDLIRGHVSVSDFALSDFVIMRSNNIPTYNFAVVVDDYDMEISHVLRGEEHLPNTPYQIAIYHALGWEKKIPKFGHLSIIVDQNRKKLSKRSGYELYFIEGLIEKGYLPEAILNFLALLGWSCGEKEIFSLDDLIKNFDLSGISKSPALFDVEKLNWINQKYLQAMPPDNYFNFLIPIFNVDLGEDNIRKRVFALALQNHIQYGAQLNNLAADFYKLRAHTPKQLAFLSKSKHLLDSAFSYFPEESVGWDSNILRNYLKQLSQFTNLKGKSFYKPLRVAFSAQEEGFELVNVLECLGRDKSLFNLSTVLRAINA